MKEVASLVFTARRTLSYTYPLRFYLKEETKQDLFDFNQQEMEKHLDKLTELSEKDWL